MAELASPTSEKDHERHHQFRFDHLEKSGFFEGFRVSDRFGDHPREAEGENGVGDDAVLGAFDRYDVRQPDETGLRCGVMSFQRLAEHSP